MIFFFFLVPVLKILMKPTAKFFFDRLIRRENPVLSEWCFFNSVTYVRGVYYVVVDFLRGSEAEKKIFERRYRISFLINRAVVENLSNVICVFSNDVSCDEGFYNPRLFDSEKIARIVIAAIENRV